MGAGGSTKPEPKVSTTSTASAGGGGRAVAVGTASGGGSGSVVRSSSGPDPSRKTSDPKPSVPKESIKSTANPTSDGLPEYWYHNKMPSNVSFDEMYYTQDKDIHSTFDELFKESYVASATRDRKCPTGEHGSTPGGCECVKPGGDPGLPVAFRTRRVIRVEASEMWRSYVKKRNVIRNRRAEGVEPMDPPPKTQSVVDSHSGMFAPLDPTVNELYAFHGTFVRYALSIAENDFNIDLAGSSTGTLYGRGAYLGESITKADEYAKDEPGGFYEGVFAVLVCRVTMGKMNVTSSDTEAGEKVKRMEYDSTCGKRLFRELVIYYSDQCYPEYLVLYQRVHAKDVEDEISNVLKRKFFMQVPLHWRNVATDLTKKHFRDHHELADSGYQHMQCLVNQARVAPSRKLQRVLRLEDSSLWEQFVEFKRDLRERLGGEEGISAVTSEMDNKLKVNAVEKDLRALMKRPCKFLKSGCKRGDKCKFSHNEFAAAMDDMGLAASRRLPVDELDRRLHEGFLWLACSTHDEAEEVSTGKSCKGTCFFENLDTALKEVKSKDGLKYAILCRVLCGVPGDDSSASDDKDCVILKVDSNNRRQVLIKESSAVYPEYFLELYSQEDEEAEKAAAEAPETAEAPEGGDEAAGFSNAVEEAPEDAPVEADEELSEEERRALEEPLHLGNGNEEIGNDELPVPVRDPDDISEEGSDPGDPGDVDEDEIRYGDDEESDVDPADLGPYWYIKRDDSGMMDGEPSELPEDAIACAEREAEWGDFIIVVDKNFKILKQWNQPKGKAAAKLNEMREFWELSKDDEEWSSDGSYF